MVRSLGRLPAPSIAGGDVDTGWGQISWELPTRSVPVPFLSQERKPQNNQRATSRVVNGTVFFLILVSILLRCVYTKKSSILMQ